MGVVLLGIGGLTATAQLIVTVSAPKVTANKAVVTLGLKNDLNEKIESARAVCWLVDEQGHVHGQPVTRWVIGGTLSESTGAEAAPDTGLASGSTNVFHFVITSPSTSGFATTNLTAKVHFTRLVVEGGKAADPTKDVQIQNADK